MVEGTEEKREKGDDPFCLTTLHSLTGRDVSLQDSQDSSHPRTLPVSPASCSTLFSLCVFG